MSTFRIEAHSLCEFQEFAFSRREEENENERRRSSLLDPTSCAEVDLAEIDELLQPEPGWQPLKVQEHGPAAQAHRRTGVGSFVPWEANQRLALRVYQLHDQGPLVGRAWFGALAMGPPGAAHGGAQAAVLDHAMGAAVWTAGYPSQTASYSHDYRKLVALGRAYDVYTSVDSIEGRKVRVSSRLQRTRRGETVVYSEASALFIRISDEFLKSFVRGSSASVQS